MNATMVRPNGPSLPAAYSNSSGWYPIDGRLDAFVDSAVDGCLARHDSLDDAIDTVAVRVRTAAPDDLEQSDPAWERRWRAYFAFYDHAIMHAIRAYVERESDTWAVATTERSVPPWL